MNTWKDAKKQYESIEIPKELNSRIESIIESNNQRKAASGAPVYFLKKYLLTAAAGAAAITLLFTLALNTSTAFAKDMQSLPVIGTLARILTFRSYVEEEDGIKTSVEIPTLGSLPNDTDNLTDTVNREIERFCTQYEEEAKRGVEEYKKAFLDTGGTEEEFL